MTRSAHPSTCMRQKKGSQLSISSKSNLGSDMPSALGLVFTDFTWFSNLQNSSVDIGKYHKKNDFSEKERIWRRPCNHEKFVFSLFWQLIYAVWPCPYIQHNARFYHFLKIKKGRTNDYKKICSCWLFHFLARLVALYSIVLNMHSFKLASFLAFRGTPSISISICCFTFLQLTSM